MYTACRGGTAGTNWIPGSANSLALTNAAPSALAGLFLALFGVAIGPDAKLNFHGPALWQDPAFEAKGPAAKPGCGDFCFAFDGTIDEAVALIEQAGAEVAYGPMDQPGGAEQGQRMGTSVYTRDPDGNLLEFMTYPCAGVGGWSDA